MEAKLSPNVKSTTVGVISAIMSSVCGALGYIALQESFYSGAVSFLSLALVAFGWACFGRKIFYE